MIKKLSFVEGQAEIHFFNSFDQKEEIKKLGNFSFDSCEKCWSREWRSVGQKEAQEILAIWAKFSCEEAGRRLEKKIAELKAIAE